MSTDAMKRPIHKIGPTYLLGLYREVTRSSERPSNVRLCEFLNRLIHNRLLVEIDIDNDPPASHHVHALLRAAADALVANEPTWVSAEALARDNKALRRLLALRVAGPALYMDDGELSDASERPVIDFKRMSVADIESALCQRAANRIKAAQKGTQDDSIADPH